MGITFAFRSQTATGFDARFGASVTGASKEVASLVPAIIAYSTTGVLGGEILDLDGGSTLDVCVQWPGNGNLGDTLTHSFLWRGILPDISGNQGIWSTPGPGFHRGNMLYRSGGINSLGYSETASSAILFETNIQGSSTQTANTVHDLVWTWTYTTGTGNFQFFIDGVTTASGNASGDVMTAWKAGFYQSIVVGTDKVFGVTRQLCNEFVVWDEIIDPTNITLEHATTGVTSTGQTLNGASRTGWVDVAASVADTDPGVANVVSGTSYVFGGSTLTGTYNPPTSVDPGIGNVLSGTGYTINDVSLTGSYNPPVWTSLPAGDIRNGVEQIQAGLTQTGSFAGEVWSTITAAQIQSGVSQIQNSVTVTGTLVVPTTGNGAAGTIDLNQLKTTIKDILDTANTTTASPADLSTNLNERVQTVMTLNPEKIEIQGSLFPFVTVYADRKTIDLQSTLVDQSTARRKAELDLNIVGAVWEDNTTDVTTDPADDQLENLMENIELILRSNETIRGLAKWSKPLDVSYHTLALDEETHFRAGLMNYQLTIFY